MVVAIVAVADRAIRGNIRSRFIVKVVYDSTLKSRAKISACVLLVAILFVVSWSSGFAQRAIPELWGHRVHDEANALSPETLDLLEKKLAHYEDSTSNQLAILIIPSLEGEPIESYSLRVADHWKLGQKDKDNGVLIVVAVNDSKMRIEVGLGLEGVLPDAICSRIIRNEIAPAFRRNDFDAGISAGVQAIMQSIGGEYSAEEDGMTTNEWYLLWGAVVFFLSILIYSFYQEFRRPAGTRVGTDTDSSSDSFSSSSSSSSSSDSHHFSGGGGSFGGGGASGSW